MAVKGRKQHVYDGRKRENENGYGPFIIQPFPGRSKNLPLLDNITMRDRVVGSS